MNKTEQKVDELTEKFAEMEKGLEVDQIKRMNYRLSDAIREGSTVTEQANGWGDGEQACAMHAAVIAARARGFMERDK